MPSLVPAPIRLSAKGFAHVTITDAAKMNSAATAIRRARSGSAPSAAAVPTSSGSSTSPRLSL